MKNKISLVLLLPFVTAATFPNFRRPSASRDPLCATFSTHKMETRVWFLLLATISFIFGSAQKSLSKEEILNEYLAFHKKREVVKDSINFTWDKDLNLKLNFRIASLKNKGIDSFLVYSESFPGLAYINIDSCRSDHSTISYLIWQGKGNVTIEKFSGKCHIVIENENFKSIFSFYKTHFSLLNEEIIMPIILGAEINENKEIIFKTASVNHEPLYSLYCEIHSVYNWFAFGKSEVSDTRNLFYTYNLNLAIYKWWKLISKQLSEEFK